MRDYSKVSGAFWTGNTGRAIRGDQDAQIVALYLMTSPHANMIGVFHCPVIYISHEAGIPLKGASKGLRRLETLGFCTFAWDAELVWVHEMARYQIGDELSPKDKRVVGIQKQYENLPESLIKQGFYAKYGKAFHLVEHKSLLSPLQAPPKPETETETETETGTGAGTTPKRRPQTVAEDAAFEQFWLAYPKKVGKGFALKAWQKLAPSKELAETMLTAIDAQKRGEQWLKDGGQYIPHPSTWLAGQRWTDEVTPYAARPVVRRESDLDRSRREAFEKLTGKKNNEPPTDYIDV